MTAIAGSIPYTGHIAPTDDADEYFVTDPTWGLGGLRRVSTLILRNNIPAPRRELGMLVYVVEDNTYYTLLSGLTNSDWEISPLSLLLVTPSTSTTINFDKKYIHGTSSSPLTTTSLVSNLTAAKLGIIQKVYILTADALPNFPVSWVKIGEGEYFPNQLNILFLEWAGGTRIEYWITQEN
jgi:hypothetical protein